MFDIAHMERGNRIQIDRSRDDNLTQSGKAALIDGYLMPEEQYQDLFARIAMYYGDSSEHAQRLYDYMSQLWFMPSASILSNGGTSRGLPIDCFLNEAQDSLEDIVELWNENVCLASRGGDIGSYWGNVRSIGEAVGRNEKAAGIVPFIRVMDSMTLAVSQGSSRRGSAAVYLPIWHPEIEEFIELRRPMGGDPNRKALNLHHGVLVDNRFMKAVENGEEYTLKSPKDGAAMHKVNARNLWNRLLTIRMETGEPYMVYIDHVNDQLPSHHKMAGLNVKMSSLDAGITLPTGVDHLGHERTAVCCLSSLNLEKFDQWKDHPTLIEDVMRFLDNVLSDFIAKAPDSMKKAKYAAMRERSVGLGVMGFHGFLQSKMLPIEGVMAKVWNRKIFQQIKHQVDTASVKLANERGPCPDAADYGVQERFSNKIAVTPTNSISAICGATASGIGPDTTNAYMYETLSGSFPVKNKYLMRLLEEKGCNTEDIWGSITAHGGSVQHLDCLTQDEKDVFKTAFEIDQRWVIEHAGDRAEFVCQAQSVNVFVSAETDEADLHRIHWDAWKKGVKSLHHCRSILPKKLESNVFTDCTGAIPDSQKSIETLIENNQYEECLACQTDN